MTQTVTVPRWGATCEVRWSHYSQTGETSIRLVSPDGQPMATATVALHPPSPKAGEGRVWLKTWSEADGLPEALQDAGVVKLLDVFEPAGRATVRLAELTTESLAELALDYAGDPAKAADRAQALASDTRKAA